VSVHDNDEAGVNILQPAVSVAESGASEYSHSGDIMVLGSVSDATIERNRPDQALGKSTGLHVFYNSSDTLIKFDLPQTFPGFETATIGDFRLRLYKTWDGAGQYQVCMLMLVVVILPDMHPSFYRFSRGQVLQKVMLKAIEVEVVKPAVVLIASNAPKAFSTLCLPR